MHGVADHDGLAGHVRGAVQGDQVGVEEAVERHPGGREDGERHAALEQGEAGGAHRSAPYVPTPTGWERGCPPLGTGPLGGGLSPPGDVSHVTLRWEWGFPLLGAHGMAP